MTTAYTDPHPAPYSADELRIRAAMHDLKARRMQCTDAVERIEIQYAIYDLSQQLVTLQRQERERNRINGGIPHA